MKNAKPTGERGPLQTKQMCAKSVSFSGKNEFFSSEKPSYLSS